MRAFDTKIDLRVNNEINYMINDEPVVIDGYIINVKFVKRGDIKQDYITLDDVVIKNKAMPELRKDLRLDIYEFYNTQLTNHLNRRLVGKLMGIKINGGQVDQFRIVIESYKDDIHDLLAVDDDRLKIILSEFETYGLDDIKEADGFSDIIEYYTKLGGEDNDIIPLLYFTKISTCKTENVELPTSKRLRNGQTLYLLNPEHVTKVPMEELPVNNELLLFSDAGNFIIDQSYEGKYTIRKATLDEIWATEPIDYLSDNIL